MFYVRMIWLILFLFVGQSLVSQGLYNKAIIIQRAGIVGTSRHFVNNKSFIQKGGRFVFFGSGYPQELKGDSSIAFKRLFIAANANTSIVSNSNTIQLDIKSDGLLKANGKITLLADSLLSASVDGLGTGDITGNLHFQSYLRNGYGYKYLGSPFQAASVGALASYVDLNAGFPSVYKYDENVLSNGWVNYMSSANVLEPMKGYAFQFGSNKAARKLSVTGIVNNGSISLSLGNHHQPYTNGFHLVSNPYPSPINWDALAGWTKVNMDNAIYFFDTDEQSIYTGVYNTYINGVSSDGKANNFIPAMQAFFVRVSDGTYPVSGSLAINNQARLTHLTEVHRKINSTQYPTVRLKLKYANDTLSDPCVIYFSSDATSAFNKSMDAVKLMNSSETVPSIYSLKEKYKLSIQSAPPVMLSSKIPLGLAVKRSGEYSFEYSVLSTTPSGLLVYLYDSLNKKYIDLKHDPAYHILLSAGEHNQQFSLIFSWHPLSNQLIPENNYMPDDFQVQTVHRNLYILFFSPMNSKKLVQLSNLLGQKLFQKEFIQAGKYLMKQQLSAGVYIISVIDGNKISSKKIIIGE